MKLLFFLALIVVVLAFSFHKVFGGKGPVAFLSSPSGLAHLNDNASSDQGKILGKVIEPAINDSFKSHSGTNDEIQKLCASLTYRFQHREPPELSDIGIATTLGCTVAIDKITRCAFVTGSPQGCSIVIRYFESIDQVFGSCAVRSWAVFVDKSVQTGFDFVAAIRAATGSGVSAKVSSSGLTLDINNGDLAAALDVICDGSVVEVIQRPHVQLSQGCVSKIESIQEIPIPTTAVAQGIAQTSVDYRKVGLQLEVKPSFLGHDRLRLGVVQTNGLIGQSVKIGENQIPIIQSQTVATTVEMSVGQTVILGGVTTLRDRTSKGILHSTHELSEGSLYVILSTYYDCPKALPVDPFSSLKSSLEKGLLGLPPLDPSDWIQDETIPPFIRGLLPDSRKNKNSGKNQEISHFVLPPKNWFQIKTFHH